MRSRGVRKRVRRSPFRQLRDRPFESVAEAVAATPGAVTALAADPAARLIRAALRRTARRRGAVRRRCSPRGRSAR